MDELIPLGRIVRLQVQTDPLKHGEKPHQRYNPANILAVPALEIRPEGVVGLDDGRRVVDVHHRDHPRSRFRGDNGVSIGFTSHYVAMRQCFGDHLTDGIAGENILVACDRPVILRDLSDGVVVGDGEGAIAIPEWIVATPCAPFTTFCLGHSHDRRPDRRVTEGLRFLGDGMRGFYGRRIDMAPATISLGEVVYRVC